MEEIIEKYRKFIRDIIDFEYHKKFVNSKWIKPISRSLDDFLLRDGSIKAIKFLDSMKNLSIYCVNPIDLFNNTLEKYFEVNENKDRKIFMEKMTLTYEEKLNLLNNNFKILLLGNQESRTHFKFFLNEEDVKRINSLNINYKDVWRFNFREKNKEKDKQKSQKILVEMNEINPFLSKLVNFLNKPLKPFEQRGYDKIPSYF